MNPLSFDREFPEERGLVLGLRSYEFAVWIVRGLPAPWTNRSHGLPTGMTGELSTPPSVVYLGTLRSKVLGEDLMLPG